jgi:predicted RNA methylase
MCLSRVSSAVTATGELIAVDGSDPTRRAEWLDAVYSDTALTTQLGQTDPGNTLRPLTVPASSSTKPTLMARMLADLHTHPGHRVLEIGTGTGYNAALLCHRLGDRNVCSIDIHPALIHAAHTRLASLGHHPHLACSMVPTAGRSTPPTTGSSPPAGPPRSPTRGLRRLGQAG